MQLSISAEKGVFMFCEKCGQKLPDEASFCFKCGKSIRQEIISYIKKAEIDISVFDGTISKFGMEKEIEVGK